MEPQENNKPRTRGQTYDRELLVSQIAMMRVKSKSTHFILEFLMNDVGMSRAVAYDILGDAQKYITQTTNQDFENAFNEAVQQLEEQMSKETNRKMWLELRRELNKLRGLYRPQRVEVSGQIDHKITGIDINIQYNNPNVIDVKNIDDSNEQSH